MKIILADNNKIKKQYIAFMHSIYKGNRNYKNINTIFAKNFLFKEDLFSKKCDVIPILIKEDNNILACAMCITYPLTDKMFLSFFEALPNQKKAVDLIIEYAITKAKEKKKAKIVIGINGHISYSVGILRNNYDRHQQFGSNYNPNYYIDYFSKYCTTKKEITSFEYDLERINFDKDVLKDVYKKVSFRFLDKKNYKRDILIFGSLCDKALESTPFYYKKTKEEMYDSLKQMKYIFKEQNLIFAVKNGTEVGFILIHPDYNQLISGQRITFLKLLWGLMVKNKKIDTTIINIIGILPEHQNNKIIIGLFNEAYKIIKNKYTKVSSTFVMNDNKKSFNLCRGFSARELNKYFIYEIEVKNSR